MARKKVNLTWIANDSNRRETFKKRRKGLVKKVSELSTLCDVESCLVIYGPQDPAPVVWPSIPEATRVVARFRSMPESEKSKKMMNQEGFLRQRVMKLQDQLRKQQRENRELEIAMLMYEGLAGRSMHDVSIQDATSLAWMLEMKAKMVQQRIEMLKAPITSQMVVSLHQVMPPPPPPLPLLQMVASSSQVVPPPPLPLLQMVASSSQVVPPLPQMMVASSSQVVPPPVEGPMPVMREKTPMETAMEALDRPNWFLDLVNPNDSMIYGGGQQLMVQPYIDPTNPWLDPSYFPF